MLLFQLLSVKFNFDKFGRNKVLESSPHMKFSQMLVASYNMLKTKVAYNKYQLV